MAQIKIKQVVSRINRPAHQRSNLDHLRLKKLNREVVKEATPEILGMVKVVRHLVEVTDVE